MADYVEEVMQAMVPELDDLCRKRIFNEDEMRQIVKRRRAFEYSLQKTPIRSRDYLEGVKYEVALESLRRRRSKALHWRLKTCSDFAGIKRLHVIFDRATRRFKGDVRLWYQYVDFCLQSGSTKHLSKVLLRAVKWHPKNVHFWLLAADRELKLGHIKAARSLLLRSIRCVPQSDKLWAEFLRLEVQVAYRLVSVRHNADKTASTAGADSSTGMPVPAEESAADPLLTAAPFAPSAPTADAWAPALLLLRKALARLEESPGPCAVFLATAVSSLAGVDATMSGMDGFRQFSNEIHTAIAQRRPGVKEGEHWADVATDTAVTLWEMWWKQELVSEVDWLDITDVVAASAPCGVLQHFATHLCKEVGPTGEEAPKAALLKFASAERVASNPDTALVVLEALDACSVGNEKTKTNLSTAKASRKLLESALASSPSNVPLGMLALQQKQGANAVVGAPGLVKMASNLSPHCAARLLILTIADSTFTGTQTDSLETLLRALAPDSTLQPLLDAFLAQGLAQGPAVFRALCEGCLTVATRLWDIPKLRTALLTALLSLELRIYRPTEESAPRMVARFEEVLAALDDADVEKVEWWVRYVEFSHRNASLACGRSLPNAMDLHWRAMRSVANQALYSERAHLFLESGLQ